MRPGLTPAPHPFRVGAFRTYYLGQAFSYIGDGIIPVTFAFAALAVSDSGWGMPIVLLSLWIARMLCVAAGGTVADRVDRVAVMWVADVVRLLAQLIPILGFITGTATLWHLGISAALYGAGTAFYLPASIGLLPELLPPESLQRANSAIDIAFNTGMLLGPTLATLLTVAGGVETALFFDCATFLVSLLCLAWLYRLRRRGTGTPPSVAEAASGAEETAVDSGFRNGLRLLTRYPALLALILLWCPVQLGAAATSVLGPLMARDIFGNMASWAALTTALAAGGLLGSFLAGWVRVGRPPLYILWILALCPPLQLLCFGLVPNIIALTGAFALTAAAVAIAEVLFDTYLQRTIPNSALSRVGAVEQTLRSVMVPVGLVISLPLARWLGMTWFLGALAGLILIGGLIAGTFIHRSRDTPLGENS
ncbi:MFS transporter [Mycetocola spongiae]|uniref:MFS transporter n=1 Tax=Mycetocola spongiae TaxID=2859226 RepID=UPI001CF54F07|nr:MFS transporter [Mycetocola spongiae]